MGGKGCLCGRGKGSWWGGGFLRQRAMGLRRLRARERAAQPEGDDLRGYQRAGRAIRDKGAGGGEVALADGHPGASTGRLGPSGAEVLLLLAAGTDPTRA